MVRILLALALVIATAAQGAESNSEHEELRRFLDETINQADSFEDRFDAEVWLVDMSARLEK